MTTQDVMLNYTLDSDFEDQNRVYLTGLLTFTAVVTPLIFGVQFVSLPILYLLPWLVVAAMSGVAYLVARINHLPLASWVYLSGFSVALCIYIIINAPDPAIFLLMLIPIALATLLLETEGMIWFAVLTVASLCGITALKTSLGTMIELMLLPSIVAGTLVAIARINKYNNLQIVNWATDSQQKNARRAEIFYEQREQLKDALLQIQHANAQLEIMNVRLDEAQRKTELISKAKSIFLSNMSHELRTPLNVVIGYASSMLDMPQIYNNVRLPEVFRDDIRLIQENGQYLVGLINDILDLSKIESGKLKLHCSPVNVADLCKGVISTSLGLLKGKPVQIRPNFADDLPKVWADPLRVRQIALNLMSNAIKFTETGSVTLSAQLDGQFIRVSVTDTGIGIPENVLKTIFDRFQQASEDTDKHYGGTGLGLDISKQLSLMHGGDLTVQSKEGQGSTFSFTLPLATPEQLVEEEVDQPTDSAIQMFEPQLIDELYTVLLVEDDVNTRGMMRRVLESKDYVVVDTHDGEEALELVISLLPSLIILDINLPNVDGWEILKSLKADPETAAIPVIVCTADEADGQAHERGAALHIHKPIDPESLLVSVEGILSKEK